MAAGNSACCFMLADAPSIARLASLSNSFDMTVCFAWQRRGRLQVRCFHRGNRIKFCGHGLLACAHVWRQMQVEKARFGSSLPGSTLSMVSGGKRFEFLMRNGLWWLRLQRPYCRAWMLPAEAAAGFQPPPIKSALCGSTQGYKIFEWPAGTDIATVRIQTAYLCSDRRATILTARTKKSSAAESGTAESKTDESGTDEYSFTLRYLAPQYGIEEDAATGSANAVLSDYWLQAGLQPPFRARQCSREGGIIFSDCAARYSFIGGCVVIGAKVSVDTVTGSFTTDSVMTDRVTTDRATTDSVTEMACQSKN